MLFRSPQLNDDIDNVKKYAIMARRSKALLHLDFDLIFLSPRRVSPFLAWGDFHARSRFAPSNIPEEKWGTTRSLPCSRR